MYRHLFCAALIGLLAAGVPLTTVSAQSAATVASASYQAKLAQYQHARAAYEDEADAYWNAVTEKRKLRNDKRRNRAPIGLADYVLTQPPVYSGPPRPVNPAGPGPLPSETPKPSIPEIADFLRAAAEQFDFVPQRASEIDFKRAYASAARAAGLTRDQIVGIYAFETGGNGTYDMQAGVSPNRPGSRAISPALGYNQLLSTNTVSLLAEHGNSLLAHLRHKAKTLTGAARVTIERKIAALSRMIAFSRSIPRRWSDYDRVAKTTPAGWGIQAAVLDRDIGPLLQVQNLANSLRFARAKDYAGRLSAAELELMNLTGDGNGLDMVTMPQDWRARVPTANFFQETGYARNPVARRTAVVATLIATIEGKMARAAQAPGAKDLAAAF
jgi:hypothetical protein